MIESAIEAAARAQVLRAAFHTVEEHSRGAKALAAAMGVQYKTLLNKVNPNQTSHHLSLQEALRLMQVTRDTRVMDALAEALGGQFICSPDVGQGDPKLMQDLAEMTMRFGELMREVANDIADTVISNNELARIEKEADQLRSALHRLLVDLRSMNLRQRKCEGLEVL